MSIAPRSHPAPPLYPPASAPTFQADQLAGSLTLRFDQLEATPTTIAGYGITDAYTKAETDAFLALKSDVGHTHAFADLTAIPTTLAGYGITDAAPLASPALTGIPTAPTPSPLDNSTTIATTAYVDAAVTAGGGGGAVSSVAGRTGAVVLTAADIGAGTFPAGTFEIPATGIFRVHSDATVTFPFTVYTHANGATGLGGFQLVDPLGVQYGSYAKASSSDSDIYLQSYLGGFQIWARAGSIQFAPNGTTTKWTMTTAFDFVGSGNIDIASGKSYKVNSTAVVGSRKTGWTAANGTAVRSAYTTTSVTLQGLAEHVKALIDDLMAHGLIGA